MEPLLHDLTNNHQATWRDRGNQIVLEHDTPTNTDIVGEIKNVVCAITFRKDAVYISLLKRILRPVGIVAFHTNFRFVQAIDDPRLKEVLAMLLYAFHREPDSSFEIFPAKMHFDKSVMMMPDGSKRVTHRQASFLPYK